MTYDIDAEFDEKFVQEPGIRGGSWRFLSKEEGEEIKSFLHAKIEEAVRKRNEEIITLIKKVEGEVEGLLIGSFKKWYAATKEYGGSKEEWDKLQSVKRDTVLKWVLTRIKQMKEEHEL